MSAEIDFNLNDEVKVKLTDKGREIHRKQFDDLVEGLAPCHGMVYRPKEEDSEGWSTWQLWNLMHLYGEHCYNGCDIPFETTIKIIEK